MGGISKAARNFTNLMYAKGKGDHIHRWDSENMRVALKKRFLDRLSSVVCHHRVLDFIYLGIPNRISDIRQALAQLPAFPAAAHADAEAQAQGHMAQAQAQVSEVRDFDNYIRSANSPIAVC